MISNSKKNTVIKPRNLMVALSEGILGYMLYQARCGLKEAYSEYLLYDPVVRICKDKRWGVKSEFKVDNKLGTGDKKRIDFLCRHYSDENYKIGIEIKYLKDADQAVKLENDVDKLRILREHVEFKRLLGFIVIAGNHSNKNLKRIIKVKKKHQLSEVHRVTFENQFRKIYGVTVLQVIEEKV